LTALQRRWEVYPAAPAEYLASFPDLTPLVAQILRNRGIETAAEAQAFLSRSFGFDNPFRLQGMNEAVTRLRQALRAGEAIAVYGDYDVDGVTATALLVPLLRLLGAQAIPYIPKRMEEGYGLNEMALAELASQGIKVVVTVDCGVGSAPEVAYANQLGLDLIVTDHHAVVDELPAAVAVIDPRREDDAYPFSHLAGVGLAFKLAQALLRAERQLPISDAALLPGEEDLLDLVALGTVADLAPLIGENRALVSRGLEKLNQAQRPGIAAMMQEAQLEQGQITAGTVGFVLGPRLNAAGRLDDAMVSYKLLTTSSKEEAAVLAQQLGAQNRERQRLMHEMVAHARDQVQKLGDDKIYVLADRSYQAGIAGLVASRIEEEFYRPTLVIAVEDEQSKGSARSINGFHITRALQQCGQLLVKYGGHSAAAGFTVRNEDIEAFRDALRDIAARELSEDDLVQVLTIDTPLPLTLANGETLAQVEMLQPFGVANPRPTFLSQDVRVRACYAVGSAGTSLKFKLSDGLAVWDAIAFRQVVPPEQVPDRLDVLYTLQTRVWNGQERLQLVVKDWRPAET
jgi:single-stranded-DNA-specific exonuclease